MEKVINSKSLSIAIKKAKKKELIKKARSMTESECRAVLGAINNQAIEDKSKQGRQKKA